MITIDKSLAIQNVLVTVSENTTSENPSYLLMLQNTFTGVAYQIDLGANYSSQKQRYDLFHIASGTTQQLVPGDYQYVIIEESETVPVEQGYARVIDNHATEDETIHLENPSIELDDESTISFNPDDL